MTTFTARNGITIRVSDNDKTLEWTSKSDRWYYVGETVSEGAEPGFTNDSRLADALREYFQHEQDEELGRWRYPGDPRYVVYPPDEDDEDQALTILFEPGGGSSATYTREWLATVVEPDNWAPAACAKAYFDSHPERKPWHDAQPGEVWVIHEAGSEPAAARAGMFNGRMQFEPVSDITRTIDVDDGRISDARRIWPEDAS